MLSEYRKITWLLPPPAHAAPRRPVAMGLHTSGTVVMGRLRPSGTRAGSVANYRKQESSVSQAIDFLRSDFRIWPRKDNFATEPPSPTSPVWAAPGRGARAR